MNDEYGVYFRPELAQGRLRTAKSRLFWRLGTTALGMAAVAAAWYFWPDQVGPWAPAYLWTSLAVLVGFGLANLVQFLRARADARLAQPGLAVGLNRNGLLVGQRWLPWPEVGSMIVKPGAFGASASLVTTGRDRTASSLPLDLTDTMPATLDTAVRVLSGGRAFVDLSRLD
ncbi:MAG: hypothetical protein WAL91_04205 [Propionicimonas sp.]